MKKQRIPLKYVAAITTLFLTLTIVQTARGQVTPQRANDPHYTDAGFFDIHVCNWPDRPVFFMSLFSTKQYKDINRIEIFAPSGKKITDIGMERFRVIKSKKQDDKRVFLTQTPVGGKPEQGWYLARITMRDGKVIESHDYVMNETMSRASGIVPADNSEVPVPKELSWKPINGAKHYRVFIKDLWDNEKLVLASKLLDQPKFVVPKGLVKPDGLYSWRVHARDVNEHILLGDFNHGSLSKEWQFSTGR